MTGFGNVGQSFCDLLLKKSEEIKFEYDTEIKIVGIYTPSRGAYIDNDGLNISDLQNRNNVEELKVNHYDYNAEQMIDNCKADIFIELSPLSIKDGQPAISYIERAFNQNMHVITANKGPIAWSYRRLSEIAESKNLKFLFETVVMDGTPIFNLYKDTLHGNKINKIEGILNGTTNYILSRLEDGITFEDAIKEAQEIKLAEADPSNDIDGWDGAAKICSLANILMHADANPTMVQVRSIRNIRIEDINRARNEGKRIKYICEAIKVNNNEVQLRVYPKELDKFHKLCSVNKTSAAITIYTDLAGELTIIQTDPTILQTAYGVYSDLLTIIKSIF